MDDFFRLFTYDGLMAICIGSVTHASFHTAEELKKLTIPKDKDVYFAPAMRKSHGNEKSNVLGSQVLWVDVDNAEKPHPTLPPSAIVHSGHGWHLYWRLREPVSDISQLEYLNKLLIEDIPTADKATWNANRLMRVPGSTNNKKEPSVPVELKDIDWTIEYNPEDFDVMSKLGRRAKHLVRTGDVRNFNSRSERDWFIIRGLTHSGATDELIFTIFSAQPCGDKASTSSRKYLESTITKARAKGTPASKVSNADITAKEDGFYVATKNAVRKVSTFTLEPKVLLDGSVFDAEDAIVCNVTANDFTWKEVTFSRSAFTSVSKFDKEAPVAAWQFLGSDRDLRLILPYLLDVLQEDGLPRVAATATMGLHKIKDQWLFLGDKETLGPANLWEGHHAPICWLPSKKEHPTMNLSYDCSQEEIEYVGKTVPKLNEEHTIWPMIGWYSATCLKPWLEEHRYRFPIMNVTGTKGSGKTTLIQRVFMPLFGQTDPKSFDSGTTRFVTLALLGSSNAIPLAFSEFRYELVERFIRFILLAYDTGHDARGRADQTTVDYPLSAPFTVDGEDLIADPAAQERMLVAQLHPEAVREGSPAYTIYKSFVDRLPKRFGGYYIQRVLQMEDSLENLLEQAREAMFTEYPKPMPDRIRNNHTVAYFGILLWCHITGCALPTPDVLRKSITSVFDLEAGRARTFVDVFIEDIVNSVAHGDLTFNYAYDTEANVLWFQLLPAHSWWVVSRRRGGRGSLERDAIRIQLKEAPYMLGGQVVADAWMYGVDVQAAFDNGLDIPRRIHKAYLKVKRKPKEAQ